MFSEGEKFEVYDIYLFIFPHFILKLKDLKLDQMY